MQVKLVNSCRRSSYASAGIVYSDHTESKPMTIHGSGLPTQGRCQTSNQTVSV